MILDCGVIEVTQPFKLFIDENGFFLIPYGLVFGLFCLVASL